MSNYYKLNLDGSSFWQLEDKAYKPKPFIMKSNPELNYLYLKKIDNNLYMEMFTRKLIKIDPSQEYNIEYPKGVTINTKNIEECNHCDIKLAFLIMKKKNIFEEYVSTLKDIFVNSNLCELAVAKKEEKNIRKMILGLTK